MALQTGRPTRPDNFHQPGLEQAVNDPANFQVIHFYRPGNLAHRILGIDIRNHTPFLNAQVDIFQVGPRTSR